jgi:hypothetical protein
LNINIGKMELDNIIYIIITIAIFVISLLGNIKRKQTPKPIASDEVVYSLNDFEKILDRKEEYRKPEEQKPENEEISIEQTSTENVNDSHKEKLEKKDHQKEENEINDGFDTKSAIIYSTILERKKFRR